MTLAVLTDGEIADLRKEMRGHHAEAFISSALDEIATRRRERAQYERAILWRNGHDTGTSSETIWSVMMGVPAKWPSCPYDVSDFGRCYRLLQHIPEWRPRLSEVAVTYGKEWIALVEVWDAITASYERESRERTDGTCPETYDLIKKALRSSR